MLCVSGAIGGFDGPSMLYPRLGLEMPKRGFTIARLDYRAPNEFGECLIDAMAALAFLGGIGHPRVALIGHLVRRRGRDQRRNAQPESLADRCRAVESARGRARDGRSWRPSRSC